MNAPRLDPKLTTNHNFERVSQEIVDKAKQLSSATLHEAAGKIGALPSQIKPVHPHFRICGPALTVHCPAGDNLWLHRALYESKPGDIMVIYCNDAYEHGYWGEVMSTAAKAQHLGGMIIDGGVRDSALLKEVDFPIFARGLCIRGTTKDFSARGFINYPILMGDVVVKAGDLILGDIDGIVAIPKEKAKEAVEASFKRDIWEAGICKDIENGAKTLDIYGWNY